jgi:hypothetical protein
MSDSVIKVENVSKAYRLGQIGGGTLKEDVSRWWVKLQGRPDSTRGLAFEAIPISKLHFCSHVRAWEK